MTKPSTQNLPSSAKEQRLAANINKLAMESMRFVLMSTEPSFSPTRVAFMTGRQPFRNGMGDTTVDIAGFGQAD